MLSAQRVTILKTVKCTPYTFTNYTSKCTFLLPFNTTGALDMDPARYVGFCVSGPDLARSKITGSDRILRMIWPDHTVLYYCIILKCFHQWYWT